MQHDHAQNQKPENKVSFWKSPGGITLIFLLVVGGYFLFKEHSAHIGSNWIWLILLLCPVMHLFMHGGSGNHGGHKRDNESKKDGKK